jgi:hypothetical protein
MEPRRHGGHGVERVRTHTKAHGASRGSVKKESRLAAEGTENTEERCEREVSMRQSANPWVAWTRPVCPGRAATRRSRHASLEFNCLTSSSRACGTRTPQSVSRPSAERIEERIEPRRHGGHGEEKGQLVTEGTENTERREDETRRMKERGLRRDGSAVGRLRAGRNVRSYRSAQ